MNVNVNVNGSLGIGTFGRVDRPGRPMVSSQHETLNRAMGTTAPTKRSVVG